jgi:hypothetical protein
MVEQFAERKVAFRLVGRINNRFPSIEDFRVVNRLVIKGSEDRNSLGVSASSDKPSGGFW